MRRLFLICLLLRAGAGFAGQTETDEILSRLAKIRLDKKQIYNVRDISIRRDAVSISLRRGTIAFLEPVSGKVTGAVFIGSGEVVTIPPDAVEKQQIYRFTGSPVLNDRFTAAFFRFTDDTFDEVVKEYEEHAHEDVTPDDASQFLPWDQILADRSGVLNYRILADYLGAPKPLFFAELNGEHNGWFDLVVDPRMVEEVALMKLHEQGASSSVDIWASFNRRGETQDREAAARETKAPLDVTAVEVDATISPQMQLDAKATLHAKVLQDGERVISFDLSRFLRVSSVQTENGESIPFYQHADMSEDEIRRSGLNAVVLVLPSPTRKGDSLTLRFAYAGDVIEKKGNGIFYVGERGLWYPNFGTQDRAAFQMTFHFPVNYALVATGTRSKEWEEGGMRHSNWSSDREFAVAGFNLGDFTILTDNSGKVPISVSVNNDVENIYREAAGRRALQREAAIRAAGSLRRNPAPEQPAVSPDYSAFSTKEVGESMLAGVRDTVAFFSDALGPFPYSQLTVSQFPVNFSQGWPSLLYVSTLSFFSKEQRAKLGLDSDADFALTELARAHEVAHQWFGNQVGWNSYHDQWISEAFSNYAAAMYLEHKYQDPAPLRSLLDDMRRRLLQTGPSGASHDSAGPLWLGRRLVSSETPEAYNEIVYGKGAWIVHMLRMLMRDEAGNSDERFLTMVRDFIRQFDGKSASTWDLKRVAESHMTSAMDLRADKKLDWFFDEWLMQTGIPTYSLEYSIRPDPKGFLIEGRITQEGVDDDFVMPVPVYADDQLLGRVVVSRDEGAFKFVSKTRPAKVALDVRQTILAQIRN